MIVKCFTVPELLPANNSNQSCSPEEASVHVGSSDTSPLPVGREFHHLNVVLNFHVYCFCTF